MSRIAGKYSMSIREVSILELSVGEIRTWLESSMERLKKAENIFKNNVADNCYYIIYIYLNYCWIYSKVIL
jgi:hypothetical protein